MKTLIITREQFQDLEDAYDDAMSDRNVLLLRSIKAEMVEWIEAAHTEALEINQCFDFNVQQVELAAEHQRAVLERLA
ncbi:hypothetical protein AB6880_01860 [Rahnella inusitata]|uniref:hypothetical protein n=1 Tax=Rahnella inusitata TaxID=58169 RepID=UPI0039BEBBB4